MVFTVDINIFTDIHRARHCADRMDQYLMMLMVLSFQFPRCAPRLITLLNPSNPKHQYPRGGPYRHTDVAKPASCM